MSTCEHVACNSKTDYEIVVCENEATHRVSWDSDGTSHIACEEHVTLYRIILADMDARGRVVNRPMIDRLMP